jgi:hypothetical protein
MSVLADALFSGKQTLMRRSIHHLLTDAGARGRRRAVEDVILEFVSKRGLTPHIASGIIYYTAAIFGLEDRITKDPIPEVSDFWARVLSSMDNLPTSLSTLAEALVSLVKSEGPFFFSAEARLTPIDYLWTEFNLPERALTEELLAALVCLDEALTDQQQAVILFFGSELRYWDRHAEPEENQVYAYFFEFRIAEWLLIARAKRNFREVLELLEGFAATGFWLSVDFALCNMEFILRHVHSGNGAVVSEGCRAMKMWTRTFQSTQRARFFAALDESDPFTINYIPIAQLAAVDMVFNTTEDRPINVLVEEMESGDLCRARLGLLSTRYLWRESPRKVLATLRLFSLSQDLLITEWVNRILKEIFLVYPRLVEDFFRLNHFPIKRVQQIKDREDVEDAVGFRHNPDPLLKSLFLQGDDRRREVAEWYKRLLAAGNFQIFFERLLTHFAERLLRVNVT